MTGERARPRRTRALPTLDGDQRRFLADEPVACAFTAIKFDGELDAIDRGGRLFKLWTDHGPHVLRQFIERFPGKRPRAWWRYSAPELLRKCVTGRCEPLPTHGSWRGIPMYLRDWRDPASFEASATYLQRHGLLTAAELARLSPEDFSPIKWIPQGNLGHKYGNV